MNLTKQNSEYIEWVGELKSLIQTAQIKASISVNKELLSLYWNIGDLDVCIFTCSWLISRSHQRDRNL